jgi:hypothetical protein
MVKLTKGQIENKLATLVSNNDFEQLALFVGEQPEANLNAYIEKKSCGLLALAIKNKCKECFDWILSHSSFTAIAKKPTISNDFYEPNYYIDLKLLKIDGDDKIFAIADSDEELKQGPNDEHIEANQIPDPNNEDAIDFYSYDELIGVDKAIELYTKAPNIPNSYYLKKLIGANVFISPDSLVQLEKYPEIYYQVMGKIEFNQAYLIELFNMQISSKSSFVYDTIDKLSQLVSPKTLSYLIKKVILANSIGTIGYLLKIFGSNVKLFTKARCTDVLTFSLCDTSGHRVSILAETIETVLTHVLTDPLLGDNFDAQMFIINFLGHHDYLQISNMWNKWNQLDLPVGLGPYVIKALKYYYLKLKSHEYSKKKDWIHLISNLNLILKAKWCRVNLWDFANHKSLQLYYKRIFTEDIRRVLFVHIAYILIANGQEPTEYAKKSMELLQIDYQDLVKEAHVWIEKNLPKLTDVEKNSTNLVKQPTQSKKQKTIKAEINV